MKQKDTIELLFLGMVDQRGVLLGNPHSFKKIGEGSTNVFFQIIIIIFL
jgi:hypothetical protein